MQFISSIINRPDDISKFPILITTTMHALILLIVVSSLWAGGGPNVTGAKLYIKQNDLEQAIKVLMKEIEEVNPNNEDAWYLLGYIYAREKRYDIMLEAFNKAVELKPKFKEKDKGIKVSGDTGTQFHAKNGVDTILRVVWGNAINEAIKYFNEAVAAAIDTARTFSFEKAVEYFKLAAEIMPDSTIAYRNMGAALMNLGKYEESIEPLTAAIQRNPNDVETSTMLASVYITSQRDSLALPILTNLWDKGTRTVEVSDYLSKIYLNAGDNEKAKAIYRDALETDPDNFHFLFNYGIILLETNDYDLAIEKFLKANELNPEASDLNYNLGAAYLNRGVSKREALPEDSEDKSYIEDYELAFPFLEKSVNMNPADAQIWYTLGRIAGQLNKMALAGYAISKGEETKSALDNKVIVGMQSSDLKMILGEPDKIQNVESEVFHTVEEWIYKKRLAAKGKVEISESINVYVDNGRVEALMLLR